MDSKSILRVVNAAAISTVDHLLPGHEAQAVKNEVFRILTQSERVNVSARFRSIRHCMLGSPFKGLPHILTLLSPQASKVRKLYLFDISVRSGDTQHMLTRSAPASGYEHATFARHVVDFDTRVKP